LTARRISILAEFSTEFGTIFATFIPLGFLTESSTEKTAATAVSADGLFVVGYSETPLETQAFRWTAAEGTTGIGETEGIFSTGVAKATSADGSTIVGYAFNYSDPRAFIWDVDNGIRDLKQALLELGVDEVSDWTLSEATDIAADGQTIVGVGVNPTGRTQAWAVRLP
jgi:probable HAF family extracellular repeat protein